MSELTPEQIAAIEAQIRRDWGGRDVYLRKADFREVGKSSSACLQIVLFGWRVRLDARLSTLRFLPIRARLPSAWLCAIGLAVGGVFLFRGECIAFALHGVLSLLLSMGWTLRHSRKVVHANR